MGLDAMGGGMKGGTDGGTGRDTDGGHVGRWVDAGSAMLGLPVTGDNRAEVVLNLERIAAIAARLESIPLEPDVEPLTVFVR